MKRSVHVSDFFRNCLWTVFFLLLAAATKGQGRQQVPYRIIDGYVTLLTTDTLVDQYRTLREVGKGSPAGDDLYLRLQFYLGIHRSGRVKDIKDVRLGCPGDRIKGVRVVAIAGGKRRILEDSCFFAPDTGSYAFVSYWHQPLILPGSCFQGFEDFKAKYNRCSWDVQNRHLDFEGVLLGVKPSAFRRDRLRQLVVMLEMEDGTRVKARLLHGTRRGLG